MRITVRHEGYPVHLIDDEWRCPHDNVEIEAPCCSIAGSSGYIECGCAGRYSVYCTDCDNDDMRDYEADDIIKRSLQ